MERRMKVLPICETKDMAREEVTFFIHSPIFRKAEGEVISVKYYVKDMGWEYGYVSQLIFSYNPSKLTREELLELLT